MKVLAVSSFSAYSLFTMHLNETGGEFPTPSGIVKTLNKKLSLLGIMSSGE